MDLSKIGKFISFCRKNKNLTQEALAQKLNITDRAVSKWERGICLPDASIMLKLCEILSINVNELLSGEMLNNRNYNEKAEKNLLEMAQKEEQQNKKLMMCEYVIGTISSVTFLVLMFVLSFAKLDSMIRLILFVLSFVILIIGVSFALKIETETGYYECDKCHHKYIPRYKAVYFAMHFGTTRYLKCPNCNKRSWNKKVLSKK